MIKNRRPAHIYGRRIQDRFSACSHGSHIQLRPGRALPTVRRMTQPQPPLIDLFLAIQDEKYRKDAANGRAISAFTAFTDPTALEGERSTYSPSSLDGEQLPPENTRVQANARDLLDAAKRAWAEFFDAVATKEFGNCDPAARADLLGQEGQSIVEDATLPFLVRLDKLLDDVRKVVEKVPVLPPSEVWVQERGGIWETAPVKHANERVIPQPVVAHPPIDEHPAVVQWYDDRKLLGTWETTRYHGGIEETRKQEILDRIDFLRNSAKKAIQRANLAKVAEQSAGQQIMAYLFQ